MREKRLNDAEKEFITLCLRFHKNKDEVRWSNLNKKIDRQQISRITKKFRGMGFISSEGYDINPKKLEEIKEVLGYNKEQDLKQLEHHSVWDTILPVIFVLILAGCLFFLTFAPIQKDTSEQVTGEVNCEEDCGGSGGSIVNESPKHVSPFEHCLNVRWNTTECYEYFDVSLPHRD